MTKVSGLATQQMGDDAIAEHNRSYKAEWATGEQGDEFVWGMLLWGSSGTLNSSNR